MLLYIVQHLAHDFYDNTSKKIIWMIYSAAVKDHIFLEAVLISNHLFMWKAVHLSSPTCSFSMYLECEWQLMGVFGIFWQLMVFLFCGMGVLKCESSSYYPISVLLDAVLVYT